MKIDVAGILEGVKNNVYPKEELKGMIETVSAERMSICDECENKGSNILGAFCKACGCNLKLKTKSLHSKCPIDKWLAITNKEIADQIKLFINGSNT